MEFVDVLLNGESRQVPGNLTVLGFLEHLGVEPDRVAVELNRSIVRKPEWEATTIGPGSQIEIVQFVGGG